MGLLAFQAPLLGVGLTHSYREMNVDRNRLTLVAASLIVAGAGVVVAQQAPPTPGAQGSGAQQGMDCPLARAPYSSQTPLIDLLVNPETKAVIDQQMGEVLAKLPPMLTSTQLPSFAAITKLKELAVSSAATERSAMRGCKLTPGGPRTSASSCALRSLRSVPPSCPHHQRRDLVFDRSRLPDSPAVDAARSLKGLPNARMAGFLSTRPIPYARPRRFDAVVEQQR